jgi:mitotic spindle assembly checkpoint protein MAD1
MQKSGLERRLLAAEETQRELERALAESKATIQRLESDRRWLAEREQQERQERERLESSWEVERVS